MMTKMPVALAIALMGICAGAQNLITCGDFSAAAGNLAPECRAEAGKVSLFTEEYTWNKCGKCEVTKDEPDREHPGSFVHAANVLIGLAKDGKGGFPVEAGVRYDVSFDVKSLGEPMGLGCEAVCWKTDDYWRNRTNVKGIVKGGVKAETAWSTYKGSFVVPDGTKRAAIRLSVWSSSKWPGTRQYKVGDAFLFDNVKVSKSRNNLGTGSGDVPPPAITRKKIALDEPFSDLVSYKDGCTPSVAKTVFRVRKDDTALYFDVTAEEPGELVVGTPDKVWSGDTIELQIEGVDGSRTRTHVAFNSAGGKYTAGCEGLSNDGWELRTKVGEKGWQASVKLPFAFLGLKGNETDLGINVGRCRNKARTFDCWAVGKDFQDPTGFGRVLFGGYGAELRRLFGADAPDAANRAEFEATWVRLETARLAAKFAKFKEARFSVAPVSTLSDWTQPFLPEEIFDPPTNIVVKAAVNEIRALPLALANLTDRTEDYRVILETCANDYVGAWGLEGFPPEQIVARKGLRFKDVDTDCPSTRFDPLAKLDEVGSVTVPPREAGLVWYDFDCTGVKPGVYRGRLRVIPLCEPGVHKNGKYAGKMQTIPVSLEVVGAAISTRSPKPAHYFMDVESQAAFDTAFAIGNEHYQVHSWSFSFERDANGDLDLSRPKGGTTNVAKKVANHVAWAAKHGFRPKFVIVYSAMDACAGLYGCGKDAAKLRRFWPQYVKGVKRTMNEAGVDDADYVIEVKDEPALKVMDQLLDLHKLAKETCPTVRLAMLLAAWKPSAEQMRAFIPYAETWILWRGGYWSTKEYRDFCEELKAAGREVMHYSCDVTLRLPLLQYYRQHAWFAERHGLDGAYMYQLTDHLNGAKFGAKDFKSIPYGGLFYRSFGTPVPSLRYMALREGHTDVKFLAALKEKNVAANDPEIAAFLKDAAVEVIDRHPSDATCPDRLRDRARELLAK